MFLLHIKSFFVISIVANEEFMEFGINCQSQKQSFLLGITYRTLRGAGLDSKEMHLL